MGRGILDELGDIIGRIVFLAAITIGSIGNLLIITYFLKINFGKWKKMSIYNFLIIHLAIIYIVTSVLSLVIYNEFSNKKWSVGELGCTFGLPLTVGTLPYLSCWELVLISYERYRSITRYQRNKVQIQYFHICYFGDFLFDFHSFHDKN